MNFFLNLPSVIIDIEQVLKSEQRFFMLKSQIILETAVQTTAVSRIMPRSLTSKQVFLTALYIFLASFLFVKNRLSADCSGKLDAGPAFLHVDVLESGRTIKKINMPAVKADGFLFVWNGVCLKPTFLYAKQSSSEVISGGCGIGHYFPLGEKCSFTPSVGCNFTQFKTTIHYFPIPQYLLHLKEKFHSISPYAALDASYCFLKGWRLIGSYQYVWSRTHTTIKGFESTKSSPKGSNYSLAIEKDLNDSWSVNLGAAYNTSLTKEKHGLRGYGMRLAFAYWF